MRLCENGLVGDSMRIVDVKVFVAELEYFEPFTIALGTSTISRNVVVRILTDEGIVGWGEASPSRRITGETVESTIYAVKNYLKPVLVGKDPICVNDILKEIDKNLQGHSSAKAAVDMALYDILGKNFNLPLCKLLGSSKNIIVTDITIGIKSPKEMAKSAIEFVDRGFRTLKIKVGTDPLEDVERVKAVRDAVGDKIIIRVDANQGWTPKQAVKTIKKIEKYGIELVEQPVPWWDLDGMAFVRENVDTPIAADESVHSPVDALRLVKSKAADIINIKLMKCGGINKALKIANIAEAADIELMIGCMGESTLGITGAAHFAAAIDLIKYIDLDSDLLLKDNIVVEGGVTISRDMRSLPSDSGLGIKKIAQNLIKDA